MSKQRGMRHAESSLSSSFFGSTPSELKQLKSYDSYLRSIFQDGRGFRSELYYQAGKAMQNIYGYSHFTGEFSKSYSYIAGFTETLVTEVKQAEKMLTREVAQFMDFVIQLEEWRLSIDESKNSGSKDQWIKDYNGYWLQRAYNYAEYYYSEIVQVIYLKQLILSLYENEQRIANDNYEWHKPTVANYAGSIANLQDMRASIKTILNHFSLSTQQVQRQPQRQQAQQYQQQPMRPRQTIIQPLRQAQQFNPVQPRRKPKPILKRQKQATRRRPTYRAPTFAPRRNANPVRRQAYRPTQQQVNRPTQRQVQYQQQYEPIQGPAYRPTERQAQYRQVQTPRRQTVGFAEEAYNIPNVYEEEY